MEQPIPVRIFGAPLVACASSESDAWRKVADWAGRALTRRFGDQITFAYYDLFSQEMDRFPEVLALAQEGKGVVPLIFIGDELLSAGDKISVPAIRRRLEAVGLKAHRWPGVVPDR